MQPESGVALHLRTLSQLTSSPLQSSGEHKGALVVQLQRELARSVCPCPCPEVSSLIAEWWSLLSLSARSGRRRIRSRALPFSRPCSTAIVPSRCLPHSALPL